MSNIIRNTAKFSLYIVKNYAEKGDVLVDATCGKGNDTMQLLQYSPSTYRKKLWKILKSVSFPPDTETKYPLEGTGKRG